MAILVVDISVGLIRGVGLSGLLAHVLSSDFVKFVNM
jgi:hypothetical protein